MCRKDYVSGRGGSFVSLFRRLCSTRSTGVITRTSNPRAQEAPTNGHCANPHAMPVAAASQIDAAVVRPRIDSSLVPRRIDPAPRKPTPVTTPWMTRDVPSVETPSMGSTVSRMKTAEPSDTSARVRRPAGFRRSSRSSPISAPTPTAAARRRNTCPNPSECTSSGLSDDIRLRTDAGACSRSPNGAPIS